MKIHEYNEMMAYLTRPAMAYGGRIGFKRGTSLIPEGIRGSKKPVLITQGVNKGKYAIVRFVDGKYKTVYLTKKEADKIGKLTKVILDEKTGKPIWPDPKREKEFIKDLQKKLKYPAGKLTPVELRAPALAKKYPEITERQIERATRYYRENLGLKYAKGLAHGDVTGKETATKRRNALKKYSDLTAEGWLTGNEQLHKSHMSDLYTRDVRTGTIGYAKAKINMEALDNIDAKMNSLYKKADELMKKNPKDFAIKMDEINMKGTDLAAQSGGYKKFEAIDPITKKKFVINFSSAAQELDPTDILENKKLKDLKLSDKATIQTLKEASMENISKANTAIKNLLASADKPTLMAIRKALGCMSEGGRVGLQGGGNLMDCPMKKFAENPEAVLNKVGQAVPETRTPIINAVKNTLGAPLKWGGKAFSFLGKTLSPVVTPFGAGAIWGATGFDKESGMDRAALGAELAFAPELVKMSSKITKPIQNQAMRTAIRTVLNAGMPLKFAMRAARLASPIGWATLGAEGIYQLGKMAMAEQKRINEMNPKQKKEFKAEQEEMSQFSAAEGGRVGFNEGTGFKLSPILSLRQTQEKIGSDKNIDLDVNDRTYGLAGIYEGDNWYGGGEYLKGNVKVDVTQEGETLFKDTMSKDEMMELYLGLGKRDGDRVEIATDGQGNYTFNIKKSFNQGGRVGLKEGSPKSPSRRAFLKGITALAALPIVGKFFKLGKVLESAKPYLGPTVEKVKGMPEWFPSLVKKLFTEGEDVTKQVAYKERQIVKRGQLEGGDNVDMIYDLDTGDVSIQVAPKKGKYETTSGAYNKEYELDYKKGQADETTKGKKPPDEFGVNEIQGRTDPEAMDIDWDINETTVDEAMSDLTELEAFAKNKTTKQIHKKKGTKKKDVFPDYDY